MRASEGRAVSEREPIQAVFSAVGSEALIDKEPAMICILFLSGMVPISGVYAPSAATPASGGQAAVRRDDHDHPAIIGSFWPDGSHAVFGRRYVTDLPAAATQPVIGSFEQYSSADGYGESNFKVGHFISVQGSAHTAVFYTFNAVADLAPHSGAKPFTAAELNANNNSYDPGDVAGVGPLYGGAKPWATALNIAAAGAYPLSAGIAIGSPRAMKVYHRGLSIEDGIIDADIDLASNGNEALRIAGRRADAVIDMSHAFSPTAIRIRAGAWLVAVAPDQAPVRLLRLDERGALELGDGANAVTVAASLRPASAALTIGMPIARFQEAYLAHLNIAALPVRENNAEARRLKDAPGEIYRTADGTLKVVY